MRYGPAGPVAEAVPGTLEHFLVERYLLYAHSGRHLYRGQVHHQAYPLQAAKVDELEEDVLAADALPPGRGAPLAHYARVVNTEIFAPERVA